MLESLRQTLADPHARHAMLVHAPIVLGSLAVLPLVAGALTRFRNRTLLSVAAVMLLLAAAGAGAAASAGEDAEERLERRAITAAEKAAIHEHEELGENGWIWPLIPAALVGVAAISRNRRLQVLGASLALVGSLGVAGWIALTAHKGGQLVYVHGLGVPARGEVLGASPTNALPAAPARPSDDD